LIHSELPDRVFAEQRRALRAKQMSRPLHFFSFLQAKCRARSDRVAILFGGELEIWKLV
jgi:hypothetical protein